MGLFGNVFKKFGNAASGNTKKSNHEDGLVPLARSASNNERIRWDEIERIEFKNIVEGSVKPNVFLVITGAGKRNEIAQKDSVYQDVYNVVSNYEGFDLTKVIESMACTENATFLLWENLNLVKLDKLKYAAVR